jgi:hypothetical protein
MENIETTITMSNVLNKLIENKIDIVVFEYNGSGDDGCVEQPNFFTNEEYNNKHFNYQHKLLKQRRSILTDEECEFITEHVEGILTKIEDWWNNDGGNGRIDIKTIDGSYEIENNVNYTESNTYTHTGNLYGSSKTTL